MNENEINNVLLRMEDQLEDLEDLKNAHGVLGTRLLIMEGRLDDLQNTLAELTAMAKDKDVTEEEMGLQCPKCWSNMLETSHVWTLRKCRHCGQQLYTVEQP